MIGPELRQYFIWGDKEGKPIDRDTQGYIAKAGKYGSTVIGFGSRKDFSQEGFYLNSALLIVDNTLRKYGVRDPVKIFASGMLATADKMAIALAFGADFINVARAAMNTIGCINALKCHTNECPTGVTTHNPELKKGLIIEEKRFRTANYLTTVREGVFMLAASCGIESPVLFERNHVTCRALNLDFVNNEASL